MSGWVSAWLQGKGEDDEESKAESSGHATGGSVLSDEKVPTSADEIRRKRLQKLQEQQIQTQNDLSANKNAVNVKKDVTMTNQETSPQADKKITVAAPHGPATTLAEAKRPKKNGPQSEVYVNDVLQRVPYVTLSPSKSSNDLLLLPQLVTQIEAEDMLLSPLNVGEVLYSRIIMNPADLPGGSQHPLAAVAYP
ncbi:unnamed protein product [Peronospora destructor]|uniref:Uncharacterized protein n=1 Tax=Peronospora destructor TaxID=86335 RepID=A0AAV0UQE1_9STRA|nr:unnamed protein product [Peronospora destructor]